MKKKIAIILGVIASLAGAYALLITYLSHKYGELLDIENDEFTFSDSELDDYFEEDQWQTGECISTPFILQKNRFLV